VKGQNLSWSQILHFPAPQVVPPSRFDGPGKDNKPVEVTIDDQSVFLPGSGGPQIGFRRAGLLLGNGSDASNTGRQTFHWSIHLDSSRPLNLTHEYMLVWHEANSYAFNQFSLNAGIMLEQDQPENSNVTTTGLPKTLWKVLNSENDVIYTSPMLQDEWQNFGVTLDYENNTIQLLTSSSFFPLKSVTPPLSNNNTGGGQYQLGILKKPTDTVSVVYDGYQESGIHEGLIYGGIFVEDSKWEGGCVSV